jgi:hypothetical protein
VSNEVREVWEDAYSRGVVARNENRPKVQPKSFNKNFYYWLAGWNDRDMELENQGINEECSNG